MITLFGLAFRSDGEIVDTPDFRDCRVCRWERGFDKISAYPGVRRRGGTVTYFGVLRKGIENGWINEARAETAVEVIGSASAISQAQSIHRRAQQLDAGDLAAIERYAEWVGAELEAS